jgi:hypothetical protein
MMGQIESHPTGGNRIRQAGSAVPDARLLEAVQWDRRFTMPRSPRNTSSGRSTAAGGRRRAEATGAPKPESIVAVLSLAPPPARRRAAAGVRMRRAPGAVRPATVARYRILRTDQVDPYEEPVTREGVIATTVGPAGGMPAPAAAAKPKSEDFKGTARRAAKISVAEAKVEVFQDLADLIESLPPDEEMIEHEPPIRDDKNSDRVQKERRNVRVRCFLYAASREKDNDYHLILGRDPSEDPVYMTMELSGLPPASSPHHKALSGARRAFNNFFAADGDDLNLPGKSYDFYRPPIPVEVQGSLFFDITHATGSKPGPQDLRPDMPTIWEVHPISRIVFEPEE